LRVLTRAPLYRGQARTGGRLPAWTKMEVRPRSHRDATSRRHSPAIRNPGRSTLPAHDTRAAFEALLGPLLTAAFGSALHVTHNRDDAEDLVQDAAVQAYRAFHTFTPGTNFKAWFFK